MIQLNYQYILMGQEVMEGDHQAIRIVELLGRITFTRFSVAYELFILAEKIHRFLGVTLERVNRSRRAFRLTDKSIL